MNVTTQPLPPDGTSGGSVDKARTVSVASVPMPVVVQTRTYGPDLYAEVGHVEGEALQERLARNVELLRGEEGFEGFE